MTRGASLPDKQFRFVTGTLLPELSQGTQGVAGSSFTSSILSILTFEYKRNEQLGIGQKATIGNMNVGESSGWFAARVARKSLSFFASIGQGINPREHEPETRTHQVSDSLNNPDVTNVPMLDMTYAVGTISVISTVWE